MQRSWSWLRCASFVFVAATGCGGDGGSDDGGHSGAGRDGSGGADGSVAGKGGASGQGTVDGASGASGSDAGSGGEDAARGGSNGDSSGGTGAGDAEAGTGHADIGGAGGDDSGPPACIAGTCCDADGCCLEDVPLCVEIPDGVHVTVTSSSDTPDLGTGVAAVTQPVVVDFAHEPSAPITLVATIDEDVDPAVVVVVRVDDDGNQTDVDATVYGGQVTVVVDADGTYVVAVIDTKPPAGCSVNEQHGPIDLSSNLETVSIDGVTRIEGDLSIGGTVSDLAALRCLTHVTGSVTVSGAAALATLPLPYLAVIGGRVNVTSVPLLTTIALTRLRKLGVHETDSLVLSTLLELFSADVRRLAHAPGSIVMSALADSPAESLTMAFSKLASVGGNLNLALPATASDSFAALRHVGGSVALSTHGVTLSGFSALETIDGALSLNVPSVEVVRFDALRSVGSVESQATWPLSVEVSGGASLREVGFPALTHADGSVFFHGGASETELSLDLGLTHVAGTLSIDLDAETTDLAGLAALTSVAGDLNLVGRFPAVVLPLLESVGGALLLESGTVQTLSATALTTLGASLTVRACPALQTLELEI